MRGPFRNFGYKLLAAGIALLLWGLSHNTSSIERGFDLPLEFVGVPTDLVVTEQSTDAVNIRVRGSRTAVRSISGMDFQYRIDLSGARPGTAEREVDPAAQLDLPRGVQVVSRSPSTIELGLEPVGRRTVTVRPDLQGEPAEGYQVEGRSVEPPRVRIAGARSEVTRIGELLTEPIDLSGATGDLVRTVRPTLPGRHVWLEGTEEVTVRVEVATKEEPPDSEPQEGSR